jgi:1-acyl-sn-glycerol-3-phosphate acyltransferase
LTALAAKPSATPSRLKTALTAPFVALWIMVMVLLYQINRVLRFAKEQTLIRQFHTGVKKLFNLQVNTTGELWTDTPTIYVSNHVSYMDIFVLGAALPGSFIAKSEVAGWPVFGQLANFQGTLFFERNARRAQDQVNILKSRLTDGGNLIFFPEGTSTPGTHIETFRSSLLAASELEGVRIQPVTIAYSHYEGEPMDQATRDFYAWYIPMPFLSHFLTGLGLGKSGIQLILHPPVQLADFESRKACAKHCEQVVREGLLGALEIKAEVVPVHYLEATGRI